MHLAGNAILYIIMVNLILFLLMGLDKKSARSGKWRIPEQTLFLFALAGGALGGIIGMKVFHHKTRKKNFRSGFPALLGLNIVTLVLIAVFILT